ncbi:MAG: transcriptional repressor [Actinobacteria bacterium]|nr:transcriptional repressor [Actinomycetota bacterium]
MAATAQPSADRSALRDAVSLRLQGAGQRRTPTRDAIVDVLAGAGRPVTIPEILDADDSLAQSSVYRNLVMLEQAGVVHRIVTNAEFARFELAEDLTGDHHHHLICVQCGAVEDAPASALIERAVHQAIDEVERATGFRTTTHRIDLVGLCVDCAA